MLKRFIRWLFSDAPAAAPVTPERQAAPRESFFSTEIDYDAGLPAITRLANLNARAFPKTVADSFVYAGDSAGGQLTTYAADDSNLKSIFAMNQVGIPEVQALWYGSQGFIGYQLCALMAQHWLINKACLLPARDALRKGYELTANDGETVAPEVLAALVKSAKRYRLNRTLEQYVKMGRVFGIRVALFKVDSPDEDYYVKPFNPDAITPGSYRGIAQIDPYWCVPELTSASASDPSALDFYEPTYWIVNNKRYHKSHLVIMRGSEVPDILKPSYLYGGMSVPQLIYERVYAADRTANEIPQLALSKRSTIFYTDAAKALANQEAFEQKLSVWARFRDNFAVKVADKDADKVEQHDTSLAELEDNAMFMYQLVSGGANVPITKLLGTQLKGFSSGEGEERNYHEELESIQVNDMEPLIDRHNVCVIRSEICPRFGIPPFTVECTWNPVASLSDKEAAEVRKIDAETAKVYAVDIQAVTSDEVRGKLANDEHSGYNGLPVLTNEDPQPTDGDPAQAQINVQA